MAGRNIRRKPNRPASAVTRCKTCQGPTIPKLGPDTSAVLVMIVTYDSVPSEAEVGETIDAARQYGWPQVARLSIMAPSEKDLV